MKPMMTGIEGLNFAIPIDTLRHFLQNRDAYAFDPRNPNAGFRYLQPSMSRPHTEPSNRSLENQELHKKPE
jgi:serine protease Do